MEHEHEHDVESRLEATSARERWLQVKSALRRAARATRDAARRLARHPATGRARERVSRAARRVASALYASRGVAYRSALVALVAYGVVWGATGPFLHRVDPGFVGVRHAPWGDGVEDRDFAAGLHWTVPGLFEWHALDAGTREVEFGTFSPALELRTPEGNLVAVAVSVPYRLIEGRAHRVVAESLRVGHEELVRAGVEAVLLSELGRASSEDWLDGDRRRAVLARASVAVGAELQRLHVRADRVLLQALRFPPPYESKLLEIQRGTQQRSLSEASARLKQFQLEVDRGVEENSRVVQTRRDELDYALTELETERKREVKLFELETDAEVRELRTSADREYAELLDEGRRAMLAAEVEARHAADRALEGDEGRLYLAVQAARNLRLGEVSLDPADPRLPNLLDLESATELFLPAAD